VTRPDGRRLEVIDAGPPDGVALVLCHGTPGSGLLFGGWAAACAARGVRLIGYSRPGYGCSTRQPERTVADCAGDVSAIANALGADSLLVAGHSGGGPHALACAALLPDRVRAAAVIAGAAPLTAPGLDWLAGQHPENIAEFRAAQSGGAALAALLTQWRVELTAKPCEATSEAEPMAVKDGGEAESIISEADRDAATPGNAAFAAARRDHALRAGIWGWYDDDIAETVPWGFDPAAITRPVAVWHGGQDRFVPVAHGRWLATTIPSARSHLLAGEGHYSILEARLGDVVNDLLELAR
jgi:pimeloyl-ACP methyl ester carboxylesterase